MDNMISVIRVEVPLDVKEKDDKIFNSLGLSMDIAINMFLERVVCEKGMPFEINQQSSSEFLEACKELEEMENREMEFKKYDSISKLMEDLKD